MLFGKSVDLADFIRIWLANALKKNPCRTSFSTLLHCLASDVLGALNLRLRAMLGPPQLGQANTALPLNARLKLLRHRKQAKGWRYGGESFWLTAMGVSSDNFKGERYQLDDSHCI